MTKIDALELELAARKLVEGTELDWREVIKFQGVASKGEYGWYCPKADYELALDIIEGKPVWEGDTLYDEDGYSYRASQSIIHGIFRKLSWNPLKPKTVMVELPLNIAQEYADYIESITKLTEGGTLTISQDIAKACRKALDNLK